jgi:hypothetical protein
MRALKAGVIYFLLIFAVGWILGPIRELWAVPQLGRLTAMVLEAVIILIAMMIAARWVTRRFPLPRTLVAMMSVGLVAVGLLIPIEIADVWLCRLSIQDYLASFATVQGLISLLMFLAFAAMPALIAKAGRGRVGIAADRWSSEL